MKYDFDKKIDRSDSLKWGLYKDSLPMWVADMDFDTPEFIKEAYKKRIDKGAYGYQELDDSFYEVYIKWFKDNYDLIIKKEWILFSIGVIPSVSAIVRRASETANNVLMLTPIYNTFYHSIENNGRHTLSSSLIYKDDKYEIDWNDLEEKLANPETSLMIFCNPHNPIGKLWNKEDLKKVYQLCKKYNVNLLSDEIHGELVKPESSYNPLLKEVEDPESSNFIMVTAPSKAFNIAGVKSSICVIPNPTLRHNIERGLNQSEVNEPNFLSSITPQIVFSKEGKNYLNELNKYIFNNYEYFKESFKDNEFIKVNELEATYLLWVDCENLIKKLNLKDSKELQEKLRKEAKLFVNDGLSYGKEGKYHLRINLATQLDNVKEGAKRIKEFINKTTK